MSKPFADRGMAYTVKTDSRSGLLAFLGDVETSAFEVLLYPTGDLAKLTVRTETMDGAVQAINDIAPEWSHAVARVYEEATR